VKLTRGRLITAGLVLVSALAVWAITLRGRVLQGSSSVPTAKVRRGDLEVKLYATGEVRSTGSRLLVAPPVNGQLQILKLVKTGSSVKAGDVVVEFDPSDQQNQLEQNQFTLQEAEQEIAKAKADAEVQSAEDKVQLLKAQFGVRRAELDVGRDELLSSIEAKKNELNLEEARRRLEQIEHDMNSRKVSNLANLSVLEAKRSQAALGMQQAKQNIENMVIRSPLDGVVAVKENPDSTGGFFFTGMSLPEFREGDLTFPGRPIVEILQPGAMEISAKVDESDRPSVLPGQPVSITVNSLPGKTFSGEVKEVAGSAARQMWTNSSEGKFEAKFSIHAPDQRVLAGSSVAIVITGKPISNALYVPRQAVIDQEGTHVIFVKGANGFEKREVKITGRNGSFVALDGIKEGEEVALVNPEAEKNSAKKRPEAAPVGVKP